MHYLDGSYFFDICILICATRRVGMIRQKVIYADSYRGYRVNNGQRGEYGNYPCVLDSIHERLSWMTDRHCKVLFIRFDVRFPSWFHTDGGNSEISRLFKTLSERYAYNRTTFHYVWVREQSREKHQHYHCIAMLDGNKVQNYRGLHRDVSLIWGNILGSDPTGLIDYCNKDRNGFSVENGIMLRRPSGRVAGENLAEQRAAFEDAYERCIYWGSYLAKENQKMNTPRRMRNYGASAIRR